MPRDRYDATVMCFSVKNWNGTGKQFCCRLEKEVQPLSQLFISFHFPFVLSQLYIHFRPAYPGSLFSFLSITVSSNNFTCISTSFHHPIQVYQWVENDYRHQLWNSDSIFVCLKSTKLSYHLLSFRALSTFSHGPSLAIMGMLHDSSADIHEAASHRAQIIDTIPGSLASTALNLMKIKRPRQGGTCFSHGLWLTKDVDI